MSNITVSLETPDWDEVFERVRGIAAAFSGDAGGYYDLTETADEIADMIEEENKDARLHGVGKDGQPLDPIVDATVKRRLRRGDGDGEPLDPNFGFSRVVSRFSTNVERSSPTTWVITGEWDIPWLRYHRERSGTRPARDIVGSTPMMRARAASIFHRRVEELFGRRS
jgi:hypothetical protein